MPSVLHDNFLIGVTSSHLSPWLPGLVANVRRHCRLSLDDKAFRLFTSLPNLPHLEIGLLDMEPEAVGVEQRMCQTVFRQPTAIAFEK